MGVTYADGTTEVRLGDGASVSVWFRRRTGRVVYVPGISKRNPEFEYHGMRWVGIRLDDKSLVATPVLVPSERLKAKIRFIARDESPAELIDESAHEFERDGEGWSP